MNFLMTLFLIFGKLILPDRFVLSSSLLCVVQIARVFLALFDNLDDVGL